MIESAHNTFMDATNSIKADYDFCMANPEEFISGGRVSLTVILRTVAALNPDVTRTEWLRVTGLMGINANTAAKQFKQSRDLSAECGDVRVRPDGSLEEVAF